MHADVIVIGAGLSGLACALALGERGVEALVIDSADAVGGRVRTDQREGFRLDRGFQVLQTWYPEAQRQLDYQRLDLRPFYPGALARIAGRTLRVSDVWRRPQRLPEMLASPIGTTMDKLRLLRLRHTCVSGSLEALYARPDRRALDWLVQLGFSSTFIDGFFKPFFSGVFFEPNLDVSARAFAFVFRAFALGDTALPARGMGEIPAQLASRLPPGSLRLGCAAERLSERQVLLTSGERLRARAIVVATPARETARLLGRQTQATHDLGVRGTTCFYFAADQAPITGPYLVINGEGQGPVNSLLCPSNLSEHYAPIGRALITVNCHGADHNPDALETAVRRQLAGWFGDQVKVWQRIAVYRLPEALPTQHPPVDYPGRVPLRQADWLWTCGEFGSAPSTQWALHSGRRAGDALGLALLGQRADSAPEGPPREQTRPGADRPQG